MNKKRKRKRWVPLLYIWHCNYNCKICNCCVIIYWGGFQRGVLQSGWKSCVDALTLNNLDMRRLQPIQKSMVVPVCLPQFLTAHRLIAGDLKDGNVSSHGKNSKGGHLKHKSRKRHGYSLSLCKIALFGCLW